MSSILDRGRKQWAYYWVAPTPDGFPGGGDTVLPVLIRVRWNDEINEFLDSAGRQVISVALVRSGERLELEGHLKLASLTAGVPDPLPLPIDYPPADPYQLEEPYQYFAFEDDLTDSGSVGEDLVTSFGPNLVYITGVVDKALSDTIDINYALITANNVTYADPEKVSVAFWIKMILGTPATDEVDFFVSLGANVRIAIKAGATNQIDWGAFDDSANSIATMASGFLDEWVHIAATCDKGAIQDIYVAGVKQSPAVSGIYANNLIDDKLGVIYLDNSGIPSQTTVSLDELRTYNRVLSDDEIVMLAGQSPKQFPDAFEIRKVSEIPNIKNSRISYKQFLTP